MNAATLHRIICPPTAKFKQEDLQNRKRTGKQGKAVPTLRKQADSVYTEPACFMLVGALPQSPQNTILCPGNAGKIQQLRDFANR